MFDWLPTIPEVFDKIGCTIGGHSWVRRWYRDERGNDVTICYQCRDCGKVR